MNILSQAVKDAKMSIPHDILKMVYGRNPKRSIDDFILNAVIRARVLVDCDMVGGVTLTIPIEEEYVRYVGIDGFIFHIPKDVTGNRRIYTPQEIILIDRGTRNTVATIGSGNNSYTTNLEVIGENLIKANNNSFMPGLALVCRVSNDHVAFSNLKSYSASDFFDMCFLAIKADIYNRLVLLVSEGYIQNGHELPTITNIIDKYESADEDYREFRKTSWKKIAFQNDEENMTFLIRASLGQLV